MYGRCAFSTTAVARQADSKTSKIRKTRSNDTTQRSLAPISSERSTNARVHCTRKDAHSEFSIIPKNKTTRSNTSYFTQIAISTLECPPSVPYNFPAKMTTGLLIRILHYMRKGRGKVLLSCHTVQNGSLKPTSRLIPQVFYSFSN